MGGFTFNFTKEDLDRGAPITPGWYKAKMIQVENLVAKTDGSENKKVWFQISDGPAAGKKRYRFFNEKGKGFAVPLLEALNGGKKLEPGVNYTIENGIGNEIQIYIKNKPHPENGRLIDEISDYRPLS